MRKKLKQEIRISQYGLESYCVALVYLKKMNILYLLAEDNNCFHGYNDCYNDVLQRG